MAQTKDGPLPYSFAVHKGHDKKTTLPFIDFRTGKRWRQLRSGPVVQAGGKRPGKGGAKKINELRPRVAFTLPGTLGRAGNHVCSSPDMRHASTTGHWKPRALIACRPRTWDRVWRPWNGRESAPPCAATGIGSGKMRLKSVPKPVPAPTLEECTGRPAGSRQKQEPYKTSSYYQAQMKPIWNTSPKRTARPQPLPSVGNRWRRT